MNLRSWARRRRWNSCEEKFRYRFLEFINTRVAEPEDHQLLLSAFLASRGRSLTWANDVLATSRPKVAFDDAPDTLGCGNDTSLVDSAVTALQQQGYFQMPIMLSTEMQHVLIKHLSSQECRLVSDDASKNGRVDYINWLDPQAEVYQLEESRVVSNNLIQRLLIDRTLLTIAQSYLEVLPSITNAMAWFTFPRETASDQAAQMFHFDLERIKWLKVFFFLTDVTDESGPHIFIPGTHRDAAIPRALLDHGYDRMSDDDVAGFFPRDIWQKMLGVKGSILLEDTRGLHKGTPVVEGHRLVLQFQYSSTSFGSDCKFDHGYPAACDEWADFSLHYPSVLQANGL